MSSGLRATVRTVLLTKAGFPTERRQGTAHTSAPAIQHADDWALTAVEGVRAKEDTAGGIRSGRLGHRPPLVLRRPGL